MTWGFEERLQVILERLGAVENAMETLDEKMDNVVIALTRIYKCLNCNAEFKVTKWGHGIVSICPFCMAPKIKEIEHEQERIDIEEERDDEEV